MFNDPLDAPNAHSGRACILVDVSFIHVRVICLKLTLDGYRGKGDGIECGSIGFLRVMSYKSTE